MKWLGVNSRGSLAGPGANQIRKNEAAARDPKLHVNKQAEYESLIGILKPDPDTRVDLVRNIRVVGLDYF